jgi:hypothetical protein
METLLAFGALAAAGYLVATQEEEHSEPRSETLVNYYVPGSTFEDISGALKAGFRLLELHIYSDEQDQPVVSLKPRYDPTATRSFESCCVDIVNDAFPSKDPLILSLVLHTDKSFTANRVAYHLKTIVRQHLVLGGVATTPLESLANKIVLVSGNEARGTDLEPLINLSWNDSNLRRLTYQQAAHPREPEELRSFAASNIVLVAPDQAFSKFKVMDDVYANGCQWNLCATSTAAMGFIPRG